MVSYLEGGVEMDGGVDGQQYGAFIQGGICENVPRILVFNLKGITHERGNAYYVALGYIPGEENKNSTGMPCTPLRCVAATQQQRTSPMP